MKTVFSGQLSVISLSRRWCSSVFTFLRHTGGDLVWSTLVIVTVLLPLGGLSIDVPRYFLLRSTLATAADAAAADAAQCVDIPHFQNTGDRRLLTACARSAAQDTFAANVDNLDAAAYHPHFLSLSIDEDQDELMVRVSGDLRLIFGLTPAFTVHVTAASRYRMVVR